MILVLDVFFISPSNVISFESYNTIKLSNARLPAKEAASSAIPSIKSPSPTRQ